MCQNISETLGFTRLLFKPPQKPVKVWFFYRLYCKDTKKKRNAQSVSFFLFVGVENLRPLQIH